MIMEGLPLLSLLALLSSLTFETVALKYYVTPNKEIGCYDNQSPCLTLQEYASQPTEYFTNNTIFYFEAGNHRLNSSLKLTHLCNFTFQGLPGNESVNISLGSLVTIVWEECWSIKVSSIIFPLVHKFNISIVFKHTQIAQLSNISIFGNGHCGCQSIMSQNSTVYIRDSKFIGIQGTIGAALMIASKSFVIFTGNNNFIGNLAANGGSLYLFESMVILKGNNTFLNNNSSRQHMDCNCIDLDFRLTLLKGYGGAIACTLSSLIINGESEYPVFASNSALNSGGAIVAIDGNITIIGHTLFERNIVYKHDGGAISLNYRNLILQGNISFINNKAPIGGALSVTRGTLSIFFNETEWRSPQFYGNVASDKGGAISIGTFSRMLVDTNTCMYFENNTGHDGGGIFFFTTSHLVLFPEINISFVRNHAESMGGAIYFQEDSQCLTLDLSTAPECPLLIYSEYYAVNNISLLFLNNSAGVGGSVLYGGKFNKCRLCYAPSYNCHYSGYALAIFMNMLRIVQHNESGSTTNISSQVESFKFCQNNTDISTLYLKLYPGEKFSVTVMALNQADSPVPTIVYVQNKYTRDDYRLSPSSQPIDGSCTNISFQLFSIKEDCQRQFRLYPDNPCQDHNNGLTLDLSIDILSCPIGFELFDHKCECDSKLHKFTHKCSLKKSIQEIERMRNNFWISSINTDILIIHGFHCPLDFCKDKSLNVSLHDPSVQCAFNRKGILCGKCKKNFSLALGSLHCIPCNNSHSVLIILFALAAVALIAIIFLLRLTVSVGTLNGLFFYANIIQANHQAFFPRDTVNFFTVFISWLNLNLGIETCFYDSMDIYAYSWLQFLFPFYVWFLVGCIILACRYSQSTAKYFGQNPVAILATLLLIFYSKILQAIIAPLSYTNLTYYNSSNDYEYHQMIWLYDGSIEYFKDPKHIALGLFAVLSLVLFVLPYISLLLLGHWFQGCSNWWILSWLNKIKPFMDAYHAPYRKHTRYWTGLLLLLRLILFLIFAINANGSESVNLIAVSSVSLALLAAQRRVYAHWLKDVLESSFFLNLGIFAVATFYLKEESDSHDDKSQCILSKVSIGISFITFLGILLFHISLVLKSSNIWKNYMLPFIQKSLLLSKILRITPVKDQTRAGDKDAAELQALPTSTEIDVDLREPLLEITES